MRLKITLGVITTLIVLVVALLSFKYRSFAFYNNPQDPQLYQYPTINAKKKGQDIEVIIKDVDAANDDQVNDQLLVQIESKFPPEGFTFYHNGKNIMPTTREGSVNNPIP